MSKRKRKKVINDLYNDKKVKVIMIILFISVLGISGNFMSIYAGGWDFNSVIHRVVIEPNSPDYLGSETYFVSDFDSSQVTWNPDGDLSPNGFGMYNAIPEISIYQSNFFSMDSNGSTSTEPEPYNTKTVDLNGTKVVYNYYKLGYDMLVRTIAQSVDSVPGVHPAGFEGAEFSITIQSKVSFAGKDVRVVGTNETAWAGILSITVLSSESGLASDYDVLDDNLYYDRYDVKDVPVDGSILNMEVNEQSYANFSDSPSEILNIPSNVYYTISLIMKAGGVAPLIGHAQVYDVFAKMRILVEVVTVNNYVPQISDSTGLSNPTDLVRFGTFNWFNLFGFPNTNISLISLLVIIVIILLILKILF